MVILEMAYRSPALAHCLAPQPDGRHAMEVILGGDPLIHLLAPQQEGWNSAMPKMILEMACRSTCLQPRPLYSNDY